VVKTMLLQQAIKPIPEQDAAEEPFLHHLVDLDIYNQRQGRWICQCGESAYVVLTEHDMLTSVRRGHYMHVKAKRKADRLAGEDPET